MYSEEFLKKRIIDLTVEEFLELVERANKPAEPEVIDTTTNGKRYVYGLNGIAELFGCSKTTAARLKKSGKIAAAIVQTGSLIIVDAELALKLADRDKQ